VLIIPSLFLCYVILQLHTIFAFQLTRLPSICVRTLAPLSSNFVRMRVLIKGGVWKNTEDEILKAAVMKYGKNQWDRAASLLSRKSAKQCKARWYEWLDPSIKKTEWHRDEEEKLLHLAKLMPNQWRTIAPIVGRTAAQCMEHYEKLLDQAQESAENAGSSSSGATGAADDPRRLRPGEIDPTPETKPARPDPIDMDDDEKEMLSEARARLANTMGKKSKRKARERQLEEARKLTVLQKRRELRAAGLESKLGGGSKKRKYIDYAKEIPFQKVAPAGFYDIGEENEQSRKLSKSINPRQMGLDIATLEGRHATEDAEREKAQDQARLKKLFKANAPLAVMKVNNEQDAAVSLRRRTALSLPSPQVSDMELEDIVRMGQHNMNTLAAIEDEEGQGSGATQGLIGDYNTVYAPQLQASGGGAAGAAARTPMHEDIVMQEARNQRVLREMTPLVDNDDGKGLGTLYEGTGFQGMAPRKTVMATPNTVLGATPGHGGDVGAARRCPWRATARNSRPPFVPPRVHWCVISLDSMILPGSLSVTTPSEVLVPLLLLLVTLTLTSTSILSTETMLITVV
jgi:pre-mRNA-splicing factor CDC5/CEF1